MKCSDIASHLVDFLYEEMPAPARAELEAHLQGCPSCAAQVKLSSRTLQRTRSALRGPLNEEPPARVHAAILAAARAAASSTSKPRIEKREGFFARLWKTPWLIPAMGAAGVATTVFLIKVIKDPPIMPERERLTPPAMVTELAPAPGPTQPQAEIVQAAPAKPEEPGAFAAGAQRARPASRAPVIHEKKKIMGDPLAGLHRDDAPAARAMVRPSEAPAKSAAPAPKREAPAAPGRWAEPPPAEPLGGLEDRRDEIAAVRLRQGPNGAGAAARGEEAKRKSHAQAEAEAPASAAAPVFAPAPMAAPAAPGEARPKAKKSVETREALAEESATADSVPLRSADNERAPAERKGGAEQPSLDERVRKADKLFNNGKWSEAATAYRALLAQAPNHPSASLWRQRLLFAEDARDGKPSAKDAKKVSGKALDQR